VVKADNSSHCSKVDLVKEFRHLRSAKVLVLAQQQVQQQARSYNLAFVYELPIDDRFR
jgi:hypothetical protein